MRHGHYIAACPVPKMTGAVYLYCVMSDVGDGVGTTSEVADDGRADSPTAEAGVAAKRRRLTCSMESVEDKEEKMDVKNYTSSSGTSSFAGLEQFDTLGYGVPCQKN